MGVAIVESGSARVAVTTKRNAVHTTAARQAVRYNTSPKRADISLWVAARIECKLPDELAPDLSALVARLDEEVVGTC
jgi:hypothetical protein